MKDETYYFHQTPEKLCKELIKYINLKDNDVIFEPFAGEGAFVRAFGDNNIIITTEIEENRDYKSVNLDEVKVDWVISNPPFRLDDNDNKRRNAFYELVEYFAGKTNKGFAFLGNDYCLNTLTPRRLKYLYDKKNVYIDKIVVCNVKKWRGRYYFIIFKNGKTNGFYNFIEGTF
jgi:hypothetical protein